MRKIINSLPMAAAIQTIVLILCSGCQYGPIKDSSGFVSAMLMNEDTIILTYKHTEYRMAQGIAAFPDGGMAKYVKDRNILAAYNIKTGDLKVLRNEPNRSWANDQGHFYITHIRHPLAIASQGGQDRELKGSLFRTYLINVETGEIKPLNIEDDMKLKGYHILEKHFADNAGNIVLIMNPTSAAKPDDNGEKSELWLRNSAGTYTMLAPTWHYQATENGEIIYWMEKTRQFKAYNIKTGQTRYLQDYRPPALPDITRGVMTSSDRKQLEFGTKSNDQWSYAPLDIPISKLK